MLEDKLVGQPSNSWYISFCCTCLNYISKTLTSEQQLLDWDLNPGLNNKPGTIVSPNHQHQNTNSVSEAGRRDFTLVQLSALTTESSQH